MTIANFFVETPILIRELALLAVRGLVLGGIAGTAMFAFRLRSASVRLFAWTTVLYGALALPILAWVLPPLAAPIPFPNMTPEKPAATVHTVSTRVAVQTKPGTRTMAEPRIKADDQLPSDSGVRLSVADLPSNVRNEAAETLFSSISWSSVAVWTYCGVFLFLLVRLGIGQMMTWRLRRSSQIIDDRLVQSQVKACGHALLSPALPEVAESEALSVPVTVGIVRPMILVPAGWREWESAKLTAVIAHEISHVVRRDALTQYVSLLYRAIFWFSPFSWWLHRHLAELAEQASDEAVLSFGADRTDYARTLLAFFEAIQTAPRRVWWQGVAMAKAGQAERRLEKILAWRGALGMGLRKSIAGVIITLAIPVVYVAASVHAAGYEAAPQHLAIPPAPAQPAPRAMPTPAAPSAAPDTSTAPEPALAPELSTAPEPGVAPEPAQAPEPGSEPEPALAPSDAPPAPPAAMVAPVAPVPVAGVAALVAALAAQSHSNHVGNAYAFGYDDDDQRFVIVRGNSESLTMSGSSEDARHVEKLRKSISGDFIWFQRDEKSYVIRDQATVDRALKLWAPQEALGKKQEELGKQQEALGKQQEQLGKRMEEVRVKVPDMTAQLDKLRAEMKELSTGATQEQIGRLQSEIGELQSKIGEIQSHAGDQQSKLGEEMGALGEQQGKLGEQQGELGRQQGELAREATRQMRDLLDEALKNGKAQPEPDNGGGASL